jgi:hypothetical protein
MVRRDGRGNIWSARLYEGYSIDRRNMLENDLQGRKIKNERRDDAVDKHCLPVKDVDMGISHFTMQKQWHADALHGAERRVDVSDVRNAVN